VNPQPEAAWELHLFFTGLGIPYAIIGGIQKIVDRFPPRIADAAAFARRNRIILVQASNGCPVDISMGLPGYEDEVMRRTVDYELEFDKKIRLCCAEDLIIHKLVAGRPRDLEDIRGILIHQRHLDESYLKRWLPPFREILGRDLLQDLESIKRGL